MGIIFLQLFVFLGFLFLHLSLTKYFTNFVYTLQVRRVFECCNVFIQLYNHCKRHMFASINFEYELSCQNGSFFVDFRNSMGNYTKHKLFNLRKHSVNVITSLSNLKVVYSFNVVNHNNVQT